MKQVITNRSASASLLSMDELTGRVWMRRDHIPGLRFARRKERPGKNEARTEIVAFYSGPLTSLPELDILTMPGLKWSFERALLNHRDDGAAAYGNAPKHTRLWAVECEEAIYRASLNWMPGSQTSLESIPPLGASQALRTECIEGYYRMTFERFVTENDQVFDGAWLDFNGAPSLWRMDRIAHFWRNRIRHSMAITFARARMQEQVMAILNRSHLTVEEWILEVLGNPTIVRERYYNDGMPMAQFILSK